ncbi:MAG: L-aspartate oxidase [Planctomycetes bacterium]|jgi:L-aspartate oxidase|nr:L-aspartate oxidase [Planctomycetota bacterium]MCL4731313.1 L-aspartate oxidase [Planctomycetota bacterium]
MDRYLTSFDTAHIAHETVDVLVIGTGVAGLSAAIMAARGGAETLMVNKAALEDSNTAAAKGGIAAVIADSDSVEAHVRDTLVAGDGLCDEAAVREIVSGGRDSIEFLKACGARFDLTPEGELDLGREGGHSGHRIVHAGGDATGAEIARALLETARKEPDLRAYKNTFVLDLLTHEGRCVGAIMMRHNEPHVVYARTTILASGGAGQLFRESTNPQVATADGHAMAIRAGGLMLDMEMVQFHPTLLYVAGLERRLITEALRGHGAYLRNTAGRRFMVGRHELAELAPRDVVSREIGRELRSTGEAAVFLDVTHLDQAELRARFPGFMQCCDDAGIDTSRSWVPVRPGPHYMIGGIRADTHGRTDIPGLLAVGEVTSTGLHGANRLASNSLLEGLVCGRRAGTLAASLRQAPAKPPRIVHERPIRATRRIDIPDLINSVKGGMWRYLGVERDERGMREFLRQLQGWARMVAENERRFPSEWQLENMLAVAIAMCECALERTESRGVHYRTDFPGHSPQWQGRHTRWQRAV